MFGAFVLYLVSFLPSLVYSIPLWIVYVLWGQRDTLHWENGALFFELRPESWPLRTWYRHWGGTTLGHLIMTRPNPSRKLKAHELIHVEQFQGQSLAGLVLGAFVAVIGHPWLALLVWTLMPALVYGASGTIAVLRGEGFYRGNVNEEAAYAISLKEEQKLSCRATPLAWLSQLDD